MAEESGFLFFFFVACHESLTQLSVLCPNSNIGRARATTSKGTRVLFSSKSSESFWTFPFSNFFFFSSWPPVEGLEISVTILPAAFKFEMVSCVHVASWNWALKYENAVSQLSSFLLIVPLCYKALTTVLWVRYSWVQRGLLRGFQFVGYPKKKRSMCPPAPPQNFCSDLLQLAVARANGHIGEVHGQSFTCASLSAAPWTLLQFQNIIKRTWLHGSTRESRNHRGDEPHYRPECAEYCRLNVCLTDSMASHQRNSLKLRELKV